jgi:hypothetical protein
MSALPEHFDGFTPPPRAAPLHVAARDPRPEPTENGEPLPRTGPNYAANPDPLAAFSRFIVTDEQVQNMKATELIWRNIIALAHLSVWCAKANGGKTTIAKFAAAEMAAAGRQVLFFQEDASAGDLPELHQHASRHGYTLLNSTLAGSAPDDQIKVLRTLVRDGADLSNFVMFFDTLKKYADLMSKGGSRTFFQLMRSVTQRGGTVILLGHVNKHKSSEGKPVFEGVGDVRNDVDELIYIDATDKDVAGIVTINMKPDKVRCAVQEVSFTLNTTTMELRPLDEVVDVGAILDAQRRREADGPIIRQIGKELTSGGLSHTELVDLVAKKYDRPRQAVREVVNRYCSDNLSQPDALWHESRVQPGNARRITLNQNAAP